MSILIESQYLPCIAYFSAAAKAGGLVLEKHEHFVKQTWRNRCYIVTSQGPATLYVPVRHTHGKVKVSEVRIDHNQKWVNNHWRAIASAYGKAPFFEYYADDLEKALYRKTEFLYDLNLELLTLCLKFLRLDVIVGESLSYDKHVMTTGEHALIDYRGFLSPGTPENVASLYTPLSYTQVFGNAFVANASIIDLIFCCGPEAGRIVVASSNVNEQLQN